MSWFTAKSLQEALGVDADGKIGAGTLQAVLDQGEGKTGRELLDALLTPAKGRMRMSAEGRALLIDREGVRTEAYRDSVGVWTIGIGHTAAAGAPVPKAGMTISRQEAEAIFARDLVQYEDGVSKALKVPVAQHQYDALVSICYNIGQGGLAGSTFISRINAGESPERVAEAILWWNKPPEVQGRRRGEALQYKGVRPFKARA